MIGGKGSGAYSSSAWGIKITASVYGKTVKLIYGLTQAGADLVWFNDWQYKHHSYNPTLHDLTGQSDNSKKSGKKTGAGGHTPRIYGAAIDMVLGHAPLAGVLNAWWNNQKFGVLLTSASGFISGGSFSFPISSGNSKVVVGGTVPSVGPFVITVPNFIANRRVRIDSSANVNLYLSQVAAGLTPSNMEYSVDASGNYTFSSVQAGVPMRITYFKSLTGSGGVLAGIYAASVHEPFSETFNDFGGPGAVTISGTWERPLWNETFPVPGRVDLNAYTARRPYSFRWDGSSPRIDVQPELEGMPVSVYYGTPAVLSRDATALGGDGTVLTDKTPLQILNMEFEREMSSGTEYTNHPDQQVQQNWCCGLGSPIFDLGASNAIPNMLFETIGAFTQWPNGDADIADVITDVLVSGPVRI
jgi:hypothetical protein